MVTVRQQVPLGLGHAIWCARAFIGDDPFAILLPDDLILSETPCMQQLADAYRETGGNVVAVCEVPREHTGRYGILKTGADDGRLVEVSRPGGKAGAAGGAVNLSIIGRYVLMPEVIGHLARMERGAGNEVQLTDGMAKLIGSSRSTACATRAAVRLRRQDRLPGGADRLRAETPRSGRRGACIS
jgi:UTP--glucose-1-phosphate uridylyltransferase